MKKSFEIVGHIFSDQPLSTCSKDLMDREGGNNKPVPIPFCDTKNGMRMFFPGTGIRGTIRRACRDAIRIAVTKKTGNPTPFNIDEIYLSTLGGIKGKGEMTRVSVAHLEHWRTVNPQLSIFGAGDAGFLGFVDGKLGVSNAVCVNDCEALIMSGARTDEFYRNTEQVQFLTPEDCQELVSRSQGGSDVAKIKALIDSLQAKRKKVQRGSGDVAAELEQIDAQIVELESKKTAVIKDSNTSDNSIGRPLAGYKCIPEGQQLRHRMILGSVTEIELGLLLAGLNVWSRMPLIGAHRATGCGLVSAEWVVNEIGDDGKFEIGQIKIGDFNPALITGEKLSEAFNAFNVFAQSDALNFKIPVLE